MNVLADIIVIESNAHDARDSAASENSVLGFITDGPHLDSHLKSLSRIRKGDQRLIVVHEREILRQIVSPGYMNF